MPSLEKQDLRLSVSQRTPRLLEEEEGPSLKEDIFSNLVVGNTHVEAGGQALCMHVTWLKMPVPQK